MPNLSALLRDYQKEILRHFLITPQDEMSLLKDDLGKISEEIVKATNDSTTMRNFHSFKGPRTQQQTQQIEYFSHLTDDPVANHIQLILNIVKRAQYYQLRSDRSNVNIDYQDPTKKRDIRTMFVAIDRLDDQTAEYLWAIGIKTREDIKGVANKPHLSQKTPNAVAQELFEMILKSRDVAPENWYQLFFALELICYRAFDETIGPPLDRFP
jgi:hypothetical protein